MRVLVFFTLVLMSCGRGEGINKFDGIATIDVDTSFYSEIKQRYHVREIGSTSKYLGGLSPQYPIQKIYTDCGGQCDNDWQSQGMICACIGYVIVVDGKTRIIHNKDEFKKTFAPIENYKEAFSYVIAITMNFPILDDNFFTDSFTYFESNIKISNVTEDDNGYYVSLFRYKQFGCGEHPYYSVLFHVTKDGEIKEISRRKSFKNSEDDSLCVD